MHCFQHVNRNPVYTYGTAETFADLQLGLKGKTWLKTAGSTVHMAPKLGTSCPHWPSGSRAYGK